MVSIDCCEAKRSTFQWGNYSVKYFIFFVFLIFQGILLEDCHSLFSIVSIRVGYHTCDCLFEAVLLWLYMYLGFESVPVDLLCLDLIGTLFCIFNFSWLGSCFLLNTGVGIPNFVQLMRDLGHSLFYWSV